MRELCLRKGWRRLHQLFAPSKGHDSIPLHPVVGSAQPATLSPVVPSASPRSPSPQLAFPHNPDSAVQPLLTPTGESDDAIIDVDVSETPDAAPASPSVSILSSSIQSDSLPPFTQSCSPCFKWGDIDGASYRNAINDAYSEVVHWRRNVFKVPSGRVGKLFVCELACLFLAYAEGTTLESIALTAAMTMPSLLLQKPHRSSKVKEHIHCLECRLKLWTEGDLDGLLREGCTIQRRLPNLPRDPKLDQQLARSFAKQGKSGLHTQGDPLEMAMYTIGILPLIHRLDQQVKQVWYANDASAGGSLHHLHSWWNQLLRCGPEYGYFANAAKTWLIVKQEHLPLATELFADSGVQIMCKEEDT